MAKKEKLSLDEMLEQALVKDEDKSYEVPNNWIWTKLGNIATIVGGGTPSTLVDEYYTNGDIAWITPADLSGYNDIYISNGKRNITRFGLEKSSARLMPKDTVILSSRAPIGYVAIASNELCTNQGFKSFLPSPIYRPKFLYFYLIQNKGMLESFASGTTFLELSGKKASQIQIPIPPLSEQQRIVDLLESLFEKLDRAKELAQNALDSFENRKSAILHEAFTGELTSKWREENGVKYNWDRKILKSVADFRPGYAFASSEFCDEGYQVIRMGNLYNGVLDLSRNSVFIKEEDINERIISRSKVLVGDILLALTGTKYKRDYGFAVLIADEANCLLNQRIVSLTAKGVETNYLWNYLKTDLFRNVFFSNETGGVNQGNVSSKFVETIQIPIPSISEQKEIVRILDNLHENEQSAKELCDVIENIDHMKKSILARAFRGELSTNNTYEESALELLKEVLNEKN